MAFATPAELAAYTKGMIPASDPRAQMILDGATRGIQRYAGWHIAPEKTETIRLDGDSVGNVLQLPSLHVTNIALITYGSRDSLLPTAILDYQWSENGNVLRYGRSCWPSGLGNIAVTFTHGYKTEDVADLKQIVLQVSAQALSSPTGATREQAGQVSMQWATTAPGVAGGLSLLARDLEIVNAYKLPARV